MPRPRCRYTVALLGAPNAGKTTLFNALTGAKELVANWPGATVDVKYARLRVDGLDACLVDLPGLYSLNGTGPEERVTREFILRERPDALIVLADSTNLERSLYLPLEALEMYDKTIVALTKIDEAEEKGVKIDVEGLARDLGVPVAAVSAVKGRGLDELKKLVVAVAAEKIRPQPRVEPPVPPSLKQLYQELLALLHQSGLGGKQAEWLALKLIEAPEWSLELLEELAGPEARRRAEELLHRSGVDPAIAAAEVAAERYRRVEELYRRHVRLEEPASTSAEELSRLDRVFLHPLLGPVASLALLLAIFLAAYAVATGSPLDTLLDALGLHRAAELVSEYNLVSLTARVMDWLAEKAMETIPNPTLARLIGEGVLSSGYGVGLVITFLPIVAVFMALVAVLEDSGLVPRIAAGMDKVFRRIGVSGKAVFPALLGFGCNVPAVLSTRIMDTRAERIAVALAVPLLPCTARYTVIMAFAYAYFQGAWAAIAAFTVYMVSITLFMLTVRLFSRLEGGEPAELVLELPPLKKPSPRVVWWLTWDKVKHFLVRAGTIILVASVALWLASNYGPAGPATAPEESYAALLGRKLAWYAELVAGTDPDTSWRIAFALLGGFIAKEVFLDSLASVAPAPAAGEPAATLRAYHLAPAQALALMLAVTLYIPCIATLAAIYSETGRARYPLLATAYTLTLATLVAVAARLLLGSLS